MTRELRVYAADGRHLQTVGRRGNGPGEFRSLSLLGRVQGDTTFVWDLSQRRVSVFSPTAELIETYTVAAWSDVARTLMDQFPRHFIFPAKAFHLNNGRILLQMVGEPNVEVIPGTTIVQDTTPLVFADREGSWSRVGRFPGAEFLLQDGLARFLSLGEMFRVAPLGDRVFVGSSHDRNITILSAATGQQVGAIELPWKRRTPSDEDLAVVRQRVLAGFGSSMLARMEDYADAIPRPDSLPMFSDLRVGADAGVWVQLYRAPADAKQEWLAFNPAGEPLLAFFTDTTYQLLDIGQSHAVVRVTDGLGVEMVRIYRLERAW